MPWARHELLCAVKPHPPAFHEVIARENPQLKRAMEDVAILLVNVRSRDEAPSVSTPNQLVSAPAPLEFPSYPRLNRSQTYAILLGGVDGIAVHAPNEKPIAIHARASTDEREPTEHTSIVFAWVDR